MPNYSNPDSMTRAELLEWAKWNFAVWDNSNTNSSAWYILLWWAYKENE